MEISEKSLCIFNSGFRVKYLKKVYLSIWFISVFLDHIISLEVGCSIVCTCQSKANICYMYLLTLEATLKAVKLIEHYLLPRPINFVCLIID